MAKYTVVLIMFRTEFNCEYVLNQGSHERAVEWRSIALNSHFAFDVVFLCLITALLFDFTLVISKIEEQCCDLLELLKNVSYYYYL